jgi:hypothetical protein
MCHPQPVRHWSEHDVAVPIALPDTFKLIIKPEIITRTCKIAWRSGQRIGVQFVELPNNSVDNRTAVRLMVRAHCFQRSSLNWRPLISTRFRDPERPLRFRLLTTIWLKRIRDSIQGSTLYSQSNKPEELPMPVLLVPLLIGVPVVIGGAYLLIHAFH